HYASAQSRPCRRWREPSIGLALLVYPSLRKRSYFERLARLSHCRRAVCVWHSAVHLGRPVHTLPGGSHLCRANDGLLVALRQDRQPERIGSCSVAPLRRKHRRHATARRYSGGSHRDRWLSQRAMRLFFDFGGSIAEFVGRIQRTPAGICELRVANLDNFRIADDPPTIASCSSMWIFEISAMWFQNVDGAEGFPCSDLRHNPKSSPSSITSRSPKLLPVCARQRGV